MVQKAKRVPTQADRLRKALINNRELYALNRLSKTPATIGNAQFSNSGGSAGGSTGPAGNFLRTAGDTMVGPIAFYPATVSISGSDSINIAPGVTSTPKGSTYVIVSFSTPDSLELIEGASFAGQLLYLQVPASSVLTIEDYSNNVSGNILTTDGNNAVITTTSDPIVITLLFDITVGPNGNNGGWTILNAKSSTSAGMGDNLGNHTATMPLDLATQDLHFITSGTERMDHGGASNIRVYIANTLRSTFDATGLNMAAGYRFTMEDEIRFNGITKPGSNVDSKIYAENLTNDNLVLNAPTSGAVRIDVAGTEVMSIEATQTEMTNTTGYNFEFIRNDTTPLDNDEISNITWIGNSWNGSLGIPYVYGRISVTQPDVTEGTPDGSMSFEVISNATVTEYLNLNGESSTATFGADLDLQSTFNLLNFGFIAAGGSEATTGAIRLANNTSVSWRNAANTNNLSFKVDDGNQFVFSTDFTVDVHIVRDESTPATGEIGSLDFRTQDSISTETSFFNIQAFADVITNGSEDAEVRFTAKKSGANQTFLEYDDGGIIILDDTADKLGFFGSTGATKQTVTGSTGGNTALFNLLAALANYGIIVDSTT